MSYYHYWGKAGEDNYHLLPYHCQDVAAVAWHLLGDSSQLLKDLADLLEMEPQALKKLLVFIIALHDLGKFAAAFQNLKSYPSSLLTQLKCRMVYDAGEAKHDRLGTAIWKEIVSDKNNHLKPSQLGFHNTQTIKSKGIESLLNTSFGHHGKPINTARAPLTQLYCHQGNLNDAADFIADLASLLQPTWPEEQLQNKDWLIRLKQASWYLAGLTTLSDWLGSNTEWFPYQTEERPLGDYWEKTLERAKQAVAATELQLPVQVNPFQSIQSHFGFDDPTPLQLWAETTPLDTGPQLFILEDVTGAGKTEAALTLTHRLMETGEAEGFYFGLPTMATSNAMFSRVADHYQQMLKTSQGQPSIVLAHGAREMNQDFQEALKLNLSEDINYAQGDETASTHCNQWLADSRKTALLAHVGVGTIDQALMAVLPMKHQSLRLLGLHRKVLIFDEVHAADSYMFELLDSLLRAHLRQGGSAILLTATLPLAQREKLCRIWQEEAGQVPTPLQSEHFPLATQVSLSGKIKEFELASRPSVSREVLVDFVYSPTEVIEQLVAAHKQGKACVWVRNSVDDALEAYNELSTLLNSEDGLLLFHSRFALLDRKNIENQVLATFGKKSTGKERQGKILIATQVFQESLDADADLMISDLCPIDDLIQRAGRLHRHTRDQQGRFIRTGDDQRKQPLLLVHAPEWTATPEEDWLSSQLQNTEYVYRSPGRLWLTQKILLELGAIRMPEEARPLIEAVYGGAAYDAMPESLKGKEDGYFGEERSKASKAKNLNLDWAKGYSDNSNRAWIDRDIEVGTRFIEQETVQVVLLKRNAKGKVALWAEHQEHPVQQSLVKLPLRKYASQLASLNSSDHQDFEQLASRYKQLKLLQPWLAEEDENFSYSASQGVQKLT